MCIYIKLIYLAKKKWHKCFLSFDYWAFDLLPRCFGLLTDLYP